MKKLLLKSMLLLCALIVGSGSIWAQTDYSATYTSNVTLSTTGGTSASTAKVKLSSTGTEYSALKAGISKNAGAIKITVPSGAKYLHLHAAGWNGESVTLTVKQGSTNVTTLSLTADAGISGSGTTYTLSTPANATTNYYKVITFASALTADTDYTFTATSGKRFVVWGVTSEAIATGSTEAPSISGNTPFVDKTTVTINNAASAAGADIYYTLNGDEPTTTTSATCFAYSAPFEVYATTTVKAIAKKSTDANASSVVSKTFTKVTPMTVGEALTAISALDKNGTISNQCVSGIVCTSGTVSSGAITYYISADGTESNRLQVYKGKGLNNAAFENNGDITVGDEVVVYGTLKNYNGNTPEFDQDSYLLSHVTKIAPTFSLDPTSKTLDAYTKESVDVTLTTNTDGAISCVSSNPDVATVVLKSAGVYTITAQSEGTATITISSAASATYKPASANVAITVEDERADAGISFADDEKEITWGDSFTGQALTNDNSVDIVWSSTDEAVATVDNTGAVTVLKAGETDIKATFAGNDTYKAAVASYTLTVNKAAAGLSYAQTSFEIMLNDDSFVAPTLINPNGLTVTYTSSNTAVAIVDANTGELLYEETAAGTAKITATFAGNDWYKNGSANYTINIVDPTVKGCKYNPYTVAEVIEMAPTSTSAPAVGQSDIYVTGYIVGEYRNKTTTNTTVLQSSFTTNANIAIADEPTTTALASSIPVNLSKTADQNAFGNKANSGTTIGCKVLFKGDVLKYFGVPGCKNIDEITAISAPVSISAAGLATFANNFALDFTSTDGIEAYIAKENVDKIELTKVNKVPAGTGVLLRSVSGEAKAADVPVATTADDVTGNIFVRGTGADVESGTGPYNYVLGKHNGVVGFYKAGGMVVAVDKAYLQTTIDTSARLDINFDETTGIQQVESTKVNAEGYYNLNGQRVAQPTKGLYIVNGKKVVIK